MNNTQFKETEIGIIPQDWDIGKLKDTCYAPQYGFTESAVNQQIGPHFLRITDITDQGVDWTNVPYCRCPNELQIKYLLQKGDILFARIGATTGKSFLINKCPNSIFASYLIRLKVKEMMDATFLYFFFNSEMYWRQISQNKGSNLKLGINGSILRTLIHPLPTISEQRAIAYVLSHIQKAIELQDRIIAANKELKKALMQKLFTEGLHGECLKETEIGKIPRNWECTSLGSFTEIIMGQSPPGNTYNKVGQGDPLINGPTEYGKRYPIIVQWTTSPTKYCEIGDVLFCVRGNTLGRLNIATGKYCIGRGVAAIRGSEQQSDTLFLFYLMDLMTDKIYNMCVGVNSTFPNISQAHLRSLKVIKPPLSEQIDIAKFINILDTYILTMEKKRSHTDDLFKSMLNLLMTGKVRVKDLEVPDDAFE